MATQALVAARGQALGLGIDAGGTLTRWALARANGDIVAEGQVGGLSALQLASPAGRQAVFHSFSVLCRDVLAAGRPVRVRAGLTGFGGDGVQLGAWLAQLLALEPDAVSLCNDIEIAYLDGFPPGPGAARGYLVYAGTGSIAAWLDDDGVLQRAGGRGVVLDDGGGGFWIARAALRHIWRLEDEAPGSWRTSAMARAVFEHIGGSDWAHSRHFIYGQERGEIGKLALTVAATADQDGAALAILQEAGRELARLALAMRRRYGARAVLLAGRAATLHPAIAAAMQAALPADVVLQQRNVRPQCAAARLAAVDFVSSAMHVGD